MALSTDSGTGVGPGIIRVSLSCTARRVPIGESRKQRLIPLSPSPSSGLTLPVWVASAARAALLALLGHPFEPQQLVTQPDGGAPLVVPVRSRPG